MLNAEQFGHRSTYRPTYARRAMGSGIRRQGHGSFGFVTVRRPYITFSGKRGETFRGISESMREH